MTTTKTCPECGNEFLANSNRQKYCSADCRFGRAKCDGCGVEFQRTGTTGRNQRFCSTTCYYDTEARTRNRTCEQCGAECAAGNKFCSPQCAALASRAAMAKTICLHCGVEFTTKASLNRQFCSRSCSSRYRNARPQNVSPVGTRREHAAGYIQIKTFDGWMFEHRAVMEAELDRILDPRERVHHRNGKRNDNRPENLELWRLKTKDPAGVRAADYHCHGCRCGES